tara:strand:- start:183 stop:1097 length:915 start_codon:yes stop_codon:yes gene_type:complete
MIFTRENIINKYPWIDEQDHQFIISADYDGLICASLLSHFKKWELVGYYNLESIWLSDDALKNKNHLIWVDLNVIPKEGRSIGGHITSINNEIIPGFDTSCNPNMIARINSSNFNDKFPLSTILLLLWIYNITIPKTLLAKMLVLHSDSSWLKAQHYKENILWWINSLEGYQWKWFLNNIDSKTYEDRVEDLLYPKINEIYATSGFSKLSSKYLNIKSVELKFHPKKDEDIIYNLLNLFATTLKWTPPKLPEISKQVDGNKHKVPLKIVSDIGLEKFIKKNKIFSYAITSPEIFIYTTFNNKKI